MQLFLRKFNKKLFYINALFIFHYIIMHILVNFNKEIARISWNPII